MAEKRNFSRTVYPIERLYFAKLCEGQGLNDIFPGATLIVEKQHGETKDGRDIEHWEQYREVLLDYVIAERSSMKQSLTGKIDHLWKIPVSYFTKEEKEQRYVTDIRLFNIFQQVNFEKSVNSFVKVKR